MIRQSRLKVTRVKETSIDQVYAGIVATERCKCGDYAVEHRARFLKSTKKFAIRCMVDGCKCTTYEAPVATEKQTTTKGR